MSGPSYHGASRECAFKTGGLLLPNSNVWFQLRNFLSIGFWAERFVTVRVGAFVVICVAQLLRVMVFLCHDANGDLDHVVRAGVHREPALSGAAWPAVVRRPLCIRGVR